MGLPSSGGAGLTPAQEVVVTSLADAGATYDAGNDRLSFSAAKIRVNAAADDTATKRGEIEIVAGAVGSVQAIMLRAYETNQYNIMSGTNPSDIDSITYGTRLQVDGAASRTLSTQDFRVSSEKTLDLGTGGEVTLGYEAGPNKCVYGGRTMNYSGQTIENAVGLGDGRASYTRTFSLSGATLASKGAVTSSIFDMFTMGANEAIRWFWMETVTAFTGGPSLYLNCGWTGQTGGIYGNKEVTSLGVVDDNTDHSDYGLGNGRDMGGSKTLSQANDGVPLMGTGTALKLYSLSTGGNHAAFTGGLVYCNFEIVRYDAAQIEALT